jgi:hypothetical protein
MQVQREGIEVHAELASRLKIGGRWYIPGNVVVLDKADFDVLEMRGFVVKAKPGAKAMNVTVPVPEPKTPEVAPEIKADDTPTEPEAKPVVDAPIPTESTVTEEAPRHGTSQSARRRR